MSEGIQILFLILKICLDQTSCSITIHWDLTKCPSMPSHKSLKKIRAPNIALVTAGSTSSDWGILRSCICLWRPISLTSTRPWRSLCAARFTWYEETKNRGIWRAKKTDATHSRTSWQDRDRMWMSPVHHSHVAVIILVELQHQRRLTAEPSAENIHLIACREECEDFWWPRRGTTKKPAVLMVWINRILCEVPMSLALFFWPEWLAQSFPSILPCTVHSCFSSYHEAPKQTVWRNREGWNQMNEA
jgi:hypothetical protein